MSRFAGGVVDINGQGVKGTRVTLLEVWTGLDDDLSGWLKAAKEPKADYYTARMKTPSVMNGPQVRSLVKPAVTDEDGQFVLRGVGRGRIVNLLLEGPGIESRRLFARTEAGEQIELLRERRSPDLGKYIYYPSNFSIVAGPSSPIVGLVRDAATKEPLAGVTVKSQARHGERINGWGQDFVRAVTDAQGHYRLEGMPLGSDNRIAAIAPDDKPYFSTSKKAATQADGPPLEVNFDMPRGVWIEGRITDRRTAPAFPASCNTWLERIIQIVRPCAQHLRTSATVCRLMMKADFELPDCGGPVIWRSGRLTMKIIPGPTRS